MRRGSRADGAVANLVRSGRKQPQRFRTGSFRLPLSPDARSSAGTWRIIGLAQHTLLDLSDEPSMNRAGFPFNPTPFLIRHKRGPLLLHRCLVGPVEQIAEFGPPAMAGFPNLHDVEAVAAHMRRA